MDEDDFDFKRMLEHISDPEYAAQAAAAAAAAHSLSRATGNYHNQGVPILPTVHRIDQFHHLNSAIGNNSSSSSSPSSLSGILQGIDGGIGGGGRREYSLSVGSNAGGSGGLIRSNSASSGNAVGSDIGYRLRAASDMYQRGEISSEQKAVMKNLILNRDSIFLDEFERSQRTSNAKPLKDLLDERKKEIANSMGSIDAIGLGDISIGKDRSGSASSIGNLFDLGLSRKRNASTSTPIFRTHKTLAAPAVPGSDTQMRIPSLLGGITVPVNHIQYQMSQPLRTLSPADQGSELSATGEERIGTTVKINDYSSSKSNSVQDSPDGEDETLDENSAKFKKNERERRRRAALSNGFDALTKLLRIPPEAKVDKTGILQQAVLKLSQLQQRVEQLENEREALVAALKQRPYHQSQE